MARIQILMTVDDDEKAYIEDQLEKQGLRLATITKKLLITYLAESEED